MMLYLDTASSLGWLSLGHSVVCMAAGLRHSDRLVVVLQEALEKHGVTVGALSGIAVGRGPGSYTGIRVAASLGLGLQLGSGVPLSTFCSLQAFAPQEEGAFVVAFDARAGGVYALAGSRTKGVLRWEGEARRMPLDALAVLAEGREHIITPDQTVPPRITLPWIIGQPCPPETLSEEFDLCYLDRKRVAG